MKNKTKIDINIQMELIKVSTKKLKVIYSIAGLIFMLFGGYIYLLNDSIGLGLSIGGFAVIIIFVFLWDKLLLKQFKNNRIFNDETYNHYDFEEDKLIVKTTRNEEQFGESKSLYSDITKVLEGKNYIFIFISNAQAFAIAKNEMLEGTIEDLIALLKSKVDQYKIVK